MGKDLIFIYNLALIMIYSGIIWMSLLLFHWEKEKLLLWTGIIFSAILIDDIVIFLSEMFVSFADVYNKIFMIVPTHKTLIYLITSLGYLTIFKKLLNRKITRIDYGILMLYVVFMLFAPALKNSAMKMWLYFFPSQAYNFYLGAISYYTIKKNPEEFQDSFSLWCKRLFLLTMIFNIFIVIEDTIVIFNYDTYSKYYVNMNNRNLSSDVLYLVYAGFASAYITYSLNILLKNNRIVSTVTSKKDSLPSDIEESLLYHFGEAYHLTSREREILKVLLEDKTNQEISDDLYISLGTAKTHIHNIFQKIGVVKRPQLIEVYETYRSSQLAPETKQEALEGS
jgi:DNA-binding CsgD family transcriptional regulator